MNLSGDSQYHNELVAAVIERNVPVAGTMIMPAEDLQLESQPLVDQAHFTFIDTPMARAKKRDRGNVRHDAGSSCSDL